MGRRSVLPLGDGVGEHGLSVVEPGQLLQSDTGVDPGRRKCRVQPKRGLEPSQGGLGIPPGQSHQAQAIGRRCVVRNVGQHFLIEALGLDVLTGEFALQSLLEFGLGG